MGLPIAATRDYLQDYIASDGVTLLRCCANPRCKSPWYEPVRDHQKYCSATCRYNHYYQMKREEKIVYMREYRLRQSGGTGGTDETRIPPRKTRLQTELDEKDCIIAKLEQGIKTLQDMVENLLTAIQNGQIREVVPQFPRPETLPELEVFKDILSPEQTTQAALASLDAFDF